MKKQFLILLLLLAIILPTGSHAENPPIPIGGWRTHTPFSKGIDLAIDNKGHVYCATKLGLFRYDKSSGETDIYTRLSGLSDYEISSIKFDQNTGVLVIAYLNSNIDIIYPDGSIVNIPDIKQKSLVGGKKINSICFINRRAYLSCEFGIVVLNLDRKEISDTWYIMPAGVSPNINAMAYDGNMLVAATDTGLYTSTYTDPNVFNYTGWTKMTNIDVVNGNFTNVVNVSGLFFATKTRNGLDSVFVLKNNRWSSFLNISAYGITIDSYLGHLQQTLFYTTQCFDTAGSFLGEFNNSQVPNASMEKGLREDDGTFWVADFNNGLMKKSPSGAVQFIAPNGPTSDAVYVMDGGKGNIWVASGTVEGTTPNYNVKEGIYYFKDNNWKSFNCNNDSIYQILCNFGSKSVIALAVDPNDPEHAYVGSWGNGLLEYSSNGGMNRFTDDNSTIVSYNTIPDYFLIGGVGFDEEGVLWGVCSGNRNGIFAREANGTWHRFTLTDASVASYWLYKLIVDDYGQKWVITREGPSAGAGVTVFKESSLTNSTLAGFKRYTDRTGAGSLPSLFVRDLAKDKDGAIWLGTDKGVAVIYNPGNALTNTNADAQQVIIVQDGYAQYLLESEIVTAIAVDGANRKWFGTYSSGAFLLNPDGTKQLLKFNTENSPLPSNNIISIAIDDKTGEVFFGTEKGIVSYRSDATEGGDKCEDYTVFPNPVRADYSGTIAISGLVNNADVRITDVAGNIVYHAKANGGMATWNGNNFDGKRAQTGVYTIYVTNEDGTASCITKLLFAR